MNSTTTFGLRNKAVSFPLAYLRRRVSIGRSAPPLGQGTLPHVTETALIFFNWCLYSNWAHILVVFLNRCLAYIATWEIQEYIHEKHGCLKIWRQVNAGELIAFYCSHHALSITNSRHSTTKRTNSFLRHLYYNITLNIPTCFSPHSTHVHHPLLICNLEFWYFKTYNLLWRKWGRIVPKLCVGRTNRSCW